MPRKHTPLHSTNGLHTPHMTLDVKVRNEGLLVHTEGNQKYATHNKNIYFLVHNTKKYLLFTAWLLFCRTYDQIEIARIIISGCKQTSRLTLDSARKLYWQSLAKLFGRTRIRSLYL